MVKNQKRKTKEMRTPEEELAFVLKNPQAQTWFEQQSPELKALIREIPYTTYKVREGAPYKISCPGTVVILHGFTDDLKPIVVVTAANKLPEALEHEKELFEKHKEIYPGKTVEDFHKQSVRVAVDKQWLEPYESVNENI
jgi:hypothetical protein